MKSKAEVIREVVPGLRVLDIGGSGYGEDNPYERELRDAWATAAKRTTLDLGERADIRVNLDQLPIAPLKEGPFDLVTAFDVLEHLEHPADVLRWLPAPKLVAQFPNALSPINRRMEQRGFEHLYSFTAYTAGQLLKRGGWRVDRYYYTLGKWSLVTKAINAIGSLCQSRVGTGLMIHCTRI